MINIKLDKENLINRIVVVKQQCLKPLNYVQKMSSSLIKNKIT